jgi:hypothetical protein
MNRISVRLTNFRRLILLGLLALTAFAYLGSNAQANSGFSGLLAQFEPEAGTGGASGDGSGSIDMTKVYKGVGIAAGVLIVTFITFFVVYPNVLKKRGVWPVSLYGRCACVAWILSWLIALIVLWNDLPIAPGDTFWKQQGLRTAFIAIGLIFGFVWLFFWRSEKHKS